MRKHLLLLPFLAALLPACVLPNGSSWGDLHANGSLAGYYTNLGGSVESHAQTGGGTVSGNFNVDAVGQGSNTLSPLGEARVGFAPLEFALSGFRYSESADGSYNGYFLDQRFQGPVHSDFTVRSVQATGGLDLISNGIVRVGALIGLHNLDADLRLDARNGSASARFDDSVTVPVAGVRGDVAIVPRLLRAGGQITAMDIKVSGYDATFFDMLAGLYYAPAEPVELVLGWKYTSLELDGEFTGSTDVHVDLEFSGPFLGVGVSF